VLDEDRPEVGGLGPKGSSGKQERDPFSEIATWKQGDRRDPVVIPLSRPRIEHERDAEGWLVIRGNHAWLHGDRRQALREFDDLECIERRGSVS
jgi:hypothetical protein